MAISLRFATKYPLHMCLVHPSIFKHWHHGDGMKEEGQQDDMTSWPPGELGPSPDSRCRPESWAKVELWDFWAESRTIIVASKKIKESHPAKIEVTDWSIFLELYAYRVVRFRFLTSSVPQSPDGWEAGHGHAGGCFLDFILPFARKS